MVFIGLGVKERLKTAFVIFRIICRGSSTLFVPAKASEWRLEQLDSCGVTNSDEEMVTLAKKITQR
jgi:hypothetical protein